MGMVGGKLTLNTFSTSLFVLTLILISIFSEVKAYSPDERIPVKEYIYIGNFTSNLTFRITISDLNLFSPEIYKNNVVFVHGDPQRISLYNLSNKEFKFLDFGEYPEIWGNYIVYTPYNKYNPILKIYNIANNETKELRGKASDAFLHPDIFEDKVIWLSGKEVYLYNITNKTYYSIDKIASIGKHIDRAEIYDNYIVFNLENRNSFEKDYMYLYNIQYDELVKFKTSGTRISDPHIWNNYIVWSENNNDWEIIEIILVNINSMSKQTLFKSPSMLIDISKEFIIGWKPESDSSEPSKFLIYNISSKTNFSFESKYFYLFGNGRDQMFEVDGNMIIWIGQEYINHPKEIISYPLFLPTSIWVVIIAFVFNFKNKYFDTTKRNFF